VAITLRPRSIELSASTPETGRTTAKLPARFLGGGDRVIHTGFNPEYFLEAIKTLTGPRVIIDVGQNGYGKLDGRVFGRPALLYSSDQPGTRWLVMPVSMNFPATREYLGSNFPEELAAEESGVPELAAEESGVPELAAEPAAIAAA
jgi:hypothetical protein